jgi:hypothetical protein
MPQDLSRTKRTFVRLYRNSAHTSLFAVVHDPTKHRFDIERTNAENLGWERVSDVPYGAADPADKDRLVRTLDEAKTTAQFIASNAADGDRE